MLGLLSSSVSIDNVGARTVLTNTQMRVDGGVARGTCPVLEGEFLARDTAWLDQSR